MRTVLLHILQFRLDRMNESRPIRTFLALLLALPIMTSTPAIRAQGTALTPSGIAWRVKGSWRVDGASGFIRTGDPIPPGSLLLPNDLQAPHSVVVLLPDGQRVLYECFTEEECQRGFRVPSLYEKPKPFASELLARIRSVLIQNRNMPQAKTQFKRPLPREESLAALGPGHEVSIAGLAASLPDGRYTYEFGDSEAHGSSFPKRSTFVKKGPSIHLSLPSTGIYDLIIRDGLNRPRIDLFIAAVKPEEAPKLTISFWHAQELMGDWNDDYAGWPMDDFQRAYLQSIVLKIGPRSGRGEEIALTPAPRPGRTAEPTFFPRPGVFKGDVMVQLRCETPGAQIHFTMDTSEPLKDSTEYVSPISVKKTELTIKAFASSAGKKDSAVVTGIFRIDQ